MLAQAGVKLDDLEKQGKADRLHVHFESSQECEEDSYYGASLPIRMALCVPIVLFPLLRAELTDCFTTPTATQSAPSSSRTR